MLPTWFCLGKLSQRIVVLVKSTDRVSCVFRLDLVAVNSDTLSAHGFWEKMFSNKANMLSLIVANDIACSQSSVNLKALVSTKI